jgi:hypothetical protein
MDRVERTNAWAHPHAAVSVCQLAGMMAGRRAGGKSMWVKTGTLGLACLRLCFSAIAHRRPDLRAHAVLVLELRVAQHLRTQRKTRLSGGRGL